MTDGLRIPTVTDFIDAGAPCLFLKTVNNKSCEELVRKIIKNSGINFAFYVWKTTTGLITDDEEKRADDIIESLKFIQDNDKREGTNPIAAIFHNARHFMSDYELQQQIIDSVEVARLKGSHLIFIGPCMDIPPELQNIIITVDVPLPTKEELKEQYSALVKAYAGEIDIPSGKKEKDRLITDAANSALGMDPLSAENAFALSLAMAGRIDVRVIQKMKEQEVKKAGALEYIKTTEPLTNVGGFDKYKSWIERRKRVFTDEARKFGLPFPKGVLLVGVPGCLSGDTELVFLRGHRKNGRKYTLKDAFYKFHEIPRDKGRSGYQYFWIKGIPTKTLSYKDGYIGYHVIKNIVYSGKKELFELKTKGGNKLKLTKDHEIMLPDEKFKPLQDLKKGDFIVCRSKEKGTGEKGRTGGRIIESIPYELHSENSFLRFGNFHVINDQIISIKKIGIEDTFDIIMEDPYRNFLAHDIVVHNSGKSLLAKATANYLVLPLLRLDMGKVFRPHVGESEGEIRMALKTVETVSPCVLWIDEIEKGFAGARRSELNGGVAANVLSTILTWRVETIYPVMLVATSNDVGALPPEFYRKGRIDEIWATDLPSRKERAEILSIHIKKKKRNPKNFDVDQLALECDEFVGAEIEGCIEDALFMAFSAGKELNDGFIRKAISETVPQATRDREAVTMIRNWCSDRARNVSSERESGVMREERIRSIHIKQKLS